jgi:thiamine biosynthesis protein ThiS
MVVNGYRFERRDGLTLHALLARLDIDPRTVVVMRGDDVYPAGQIPDLVLEDRDVLEIVTMMQGG